MNSPEFSDRQPSDLPDEAFSPQSFDLQKYQEVDGKLLDIQKGVRFLKLAQPTNLKDIQERFLRDPDFEPVFTYEPLPESLQESRQLLNSIQIPGENAALDHLLESRKNRISDQLDYLNSRGDRNISAQISSRIYGAPSADLVTLADEMLQDIAPVPREEKTLSSTEVSERLKQALQDFGLHHWSVHFHDRSQLSISAARKTLNLPEERMFSEKDVRRLIKHEIETHIFRAENGYQQKLAIFAIGLPGYESTEEGLAAYAEKVSGTSDANVLRRYAARVLAVDSLLQGDSFVQTFRRVSKGQAGITAEEAFGCVARVFRGGGLTKDYIYLNGFQRVQKYVQSGADLKLLFVGKVGIDDLPLVNGLKEQGVLAEPALLPTYLQ